MGERKLLRWERRRRRGQSGRDARAFKSFWGFELVLLILIFSIWLIGARLIQVYAVVNSPCAEAAAAFGQSGSGPSVFDLFFWISVLTGLYWAAIGAAFWRTLWRSKSALFHGALLICIVLLMANFRLMHVDNNIPPDGTLTIGLTIVDGESGSDKYYQELGYYDKYRSWVQGRDLNASDKNYYQGRQHCVWLDRGLIIDDNILRIDGYGTASVEDRITLLQSRSFKRRQIHEWSKPSFVKELSAIWDNLVGNVSSLETLRDRQNYRPLTPEERARFTAKQKCFNENTYSPTQSVDCQYYWVYDYQSANFDYYMGNNPGP